MEIFRKMIENVTERWAKHFKRVDCAKKYLGEHFTPYILGG